MNGLSITISVFTFKGMGTGMVRSRLREAGTLGKGAAREAARAPLMAREPLKARGAATALRRGFRSA